MAILIGLILVLVPSIGIFFVKNKNAQNWILFSLAITSLFFHFSIYYVEYIYSGKISRLYHTLLFIVHPCHFAMWMLFVVSALAILGKRNERYFKWLVMSFVFVGIIGYSNNFQHPIVLDFFKKDVPVLEKIYDYYNFKSPISHLFLTIGCVLLATKYVKLTPSCIAPVFCGLIAMALIGIIDNQIQPLQKENPMFFFKDNIWKDSNILKGLFILIVALMIVIFGLICVFWLIYAKVKKEKFNWDWKEYFNIKSNKK